MNDLTMMIALYRGLSNIAITDAANMGWGTKRVAYYTTPYSHDNRIFVSAMIIKDVDLITMTPRVFTGSTDQINAEIEAMRGYQNMIVKQVNANELNVQFTNEYNALNENRGIIGKLEIDRSETALNLLSKCVAASIADYSELVNNQATQYLNAGYSLFQINSVLPSLVLQGSIVYKPFGFLLFNASNGIDIAHSAISVNAATGQPELNFSVQLSNEIIRSVKHDDLA